MADEYHIFLWWNYSFWKTNKLVAHFQDISRGWTIQARKKIQWPIRSHSIEYKCILSSFSFPSLTIEQWQRWSTAPVAMYTLIYLKYLVVKCNQNTRKVRFYDFWMAHRVQRKDTIQHPAMQKYYVEKRMSRKWKAMP